MLRSEQDVGEGLGKVAGWCVEVGTPVAAKALHAGVDTAQLSPSFASRIGIARQVDRVSQLVCDVVCQFSRVVLWTCINLDLAFLRDQHRAKIRPGSKKDDFIVEF